MLETVKLNPLGSTSNEVVKELQGLRRDLKKRDKLQDLLTDAVIDKARDTVIKSLTNDLETKCDDYIKEKYGVLPKTIEIKKSTKKKEMKGLFHKEFETITKMVGKNIPLMLIGPAGSGKNHTIEQVAEALDLDFYFTNAVTQEYKLTGFIDAGGKYHETQFYQAFSNGGVFFLDEIDASCPDALVILNSAIANGYFDFPCGRVTAHEDFRVIGAGNTYGTGADMVYVGRNVLDGATLDRFAVIYFDYDEDIERSLAYDNKLYEFIKALRKTINNNSLRYILSMRAVINATKMLEIGIPKKEILKNVILKSMSQDDINIVACNMDPNNKYIDWYQELQELSNA